MKRTLQHLLYILIINFFTQDVSAQTYDFQNINLLGRFNDTTFVANNWVNSKYAGCWGWYNPVDGREYAIIGGSNKTYIVEITNPSNPVLRDTVPGLVQNCVWREYKTYQHYLYMVSDDSGPNGMQIADLSYLPDSVHLVHNGNSILTRSHTIFVDGNKLYCGLATGAAVGGSTTSMAVFSLANPAQPVLLRKLSQDVSAIGGVHDMYVRNDTIWASAGYDGFYILKFNTSTNTFSQLGSLTTYIDQGYNHSSSPMANGNYTVMMDEVPQGMAIKIVNISNPFSPQVVSTFKSSLGDTPHNPFTIGNHFTVCANYQDGIQVYDISDPLNPVRAGYFDTHYQTAIGNTGFGYVGCWGAYPYLPSGNIIASDMQNGLYILDASAILGVPANNQLLEDGISVQHNFQDGGFQVTVNCKVTKDLTIEVFDVTGRLVASQTKQFFAGKNAPVMFRKNMFARGMYLVKARGNDFDYAARAVMQ